MNTEPTINNRLADCLRRRHPEWRDDAIVSKQTGVLLDEPLRKPDVLIRAGAPVIVEAEIAPAATVDQDAIERLNRGVEGAALPVEAVVALVYPGRFRNTVRESDLGAALSDADDLEWRIFFASGTGTSPRFPASGSIRGGVDDLAAAIETLTISPRHIEEAADTLARAVAEASAILNGLSDGCRQEIGDYLHQAPDPQTMRMAAAVLADAFLCQTAIAEGCSTPNIDATRSRGRSRGLHKRHVLDVWHEVLTLNYFPVFSLASHVLTAVPDNKAGAVCDRLAAAAQDLATAGAVEVQDLAGQMLGRLISDRKFLATFYTRPASAALLAELAASRLQVDWSDPAAIAGLRIADLACGTGALLSGAYRRVLGEPVTDTAAYAVLHHRPESLLEALETARAIQSVCGEPGTQPLRVGNDPIGWLTEAGFEPEARGHPAGVLSPDVADAARSLSSGEELRLPRVRAQPLRTVALRTLGNRGPYHLDINGEPPSSGKPPRGPFDVSPIDRARHRQASWPVLWSHEHGHETRMSVLPDSEGTPRHGQSSAAQDLWSGTSAVAGASRLHINRDFQVNSQPLGACLTPRDALGGRAWPSLGATPANESDRPLWEKALCAWLNTTPGLIARWWVSSRQQKGRANLSITTIGLIPAPDLAAISHDQLSLLAAAFDGHAGKDLLPANEAWHDPVRQSLDESVLCAALDLPKIVLGPLETLREQWCAEPSVHGGKSTRPS